MNKRAQFFIAATSAAGICMLVAAALQWHSQDPLRFVVFLILALASAGFKVALPGMNGTMSVTFLFMLLAILELSLPEALAIGSAATLLQCLTNMSRPTKWVRVLFNVCSNMVPAIFVANWVFHHSGALLRHSTPLMLMAAGAAFFLFNTLPSRSSFLCRKTGTSARPGRSAISGLFLTTSPAPRWSPSSAGPNPTWDGAPPSPCCRSSIGSIALIALT